MAVYLPAEKITVRGGFILQKPPRFYFGFLGHPGR